MTTWGSNLSGLEPAYASQFVDFDGPDDDLFVVDVHATVAAFAALRSDGSVVAWGHAGYGGSLDNNYLDGAENINEFVGLTNVSQLASGEANFAAIREDGSVVTWGSSPSGTPVTVTDAGLDISDAAISPVKIEVSDARTFAALMSDGTVKTWGQKKEDSQLTEPDLAGPNGDLEVVDIGATDTGFLAFRSDGSVAAQYYPGMEHWEVIQGLDLNGPGNDLGYDISINKFKDNHTFGLREDGSVATPAFNIDSVAFPSVYEEIARYGQDDDFQLAEIDHSIHGTTLLGSDGSVQYIRNWGSSRPEDYQYNFAPVDFNGPNDDLATTTIVSNTEGIRRTDVGWISGNFRRRAIRWRQYRS